MQTEKEYTVLLKYLIPCKGTETAAPSKIFAAVSKYLIPRKGTEIVAKRYIFLRGFKEATHTPQGDGKNCM